MTKAHRYDPSLNPSYQYLRAIFAALPRATTVEDYEELLPWRIVLPVE